MERESGKIMEQIQEKKETRTLVELAMLKRGNSFFSTIRNEGKNGDKYKEKLLCVRG